MTFELCYARNKMLIFKFQSTLLELTPAAMGLKARTDFGISSVDTFQLVLINLSGSATENVFRETRFRKVCASPQI